MASKGVPVLDDNVFGWAWVWMDPGPGKALSLHSLKLGQILFSMKHCNFICFLNVFIRGFREVFGQFHLLEALGNVRHSSISASFHWRNWYMSPLLFINKAQGSLF